MIVLLNIVRGKPLSISFAEIYITRSFFVKNFTKANKVQIFKMANVDKVLFENSNVESNLGRLYSANIKTGVRALGYKTYIGN